MRHNSRNTARYHLGFRLLFISCPFELLCFLQTYFIWDIMKLTKSLLTVLTGPQTEFHSQRNLIFFLSSFKRVNYLKTFVPSQHQNVSTFFCYPIKYFSSHAQVRVPYPIKYIPAMGNSFCVSLLNNKVVCTVTGLQEKHQKC